MLTKVAKSAVILLVAGAVAASAAGAATTKTQGLLREINRTRAAHDLRPLRLDPRLTRFASHHSTQMARTRVLVHSRLSLPVLHALAVGENLAWIPGDRAHDVVAAWMASPQHRANLLSRRFTAVGLGDVSGLVTADFAG
jgi:uncharacterized protein YkwD